MHRRVHVLANVDDAVLAIGAGAIAQVVWELWRLFARRPAAGLTTPMNATGLLLGMLIVYTTGLLVPA